MKKIISIILIAVLLLFTLTACNDTKSTNKASNNTATNTSKTNNSTKKEESKVSVDYAAAAEKQMAAPNKGETIAIIHIKNYGEVRVKFFDEVAPKAVENFTTHAKNGYYNGVTFHRVINEFMIQGGDPLGNGTGGQSIWGEDFAEELSEELVPYRGSLCMASRGLQNSPSLGSQFFITQAHYDEQMASYMQGYGYPADLMEQYKKYGGYLSLYQQYTVFGQVYEGMDVVDKVAAVQTDETDKPVEKVVIENIEVMRSE